MDTDQRYATIPKNEVEIKTFEKESANWDLISNIVAKVSSKKPVVIAIPVQKALIFPHLSHNDLARTQELIGFVKPQLQKNLN